LTLPRIEPVRPVRNTSLPMGGEWLYEVKLDGFRGMLHVVSGRGYFLSKNCHAMRRFDDLAAALADALGAREAILDGEIIVMGERGPDFNALFFRRRPPAYAAFDLLWVNGRDLRPLPLWRRKNMLRKLVANTPIGYVDATDDATLFARTMLHDLEGIVAKRREDAYAPSTVWVKVKCAGYSQMEGRWELFSSDERRQSRRS
jgi:bifunctional non-homologous end joining protein LigD